AHRELDCTKCHEHAEVDVLAEGQKRFLGLSRDCSSCHSNPHGDRMQLACVTCHSQETFRERFVASHSDRLPLQGAHGGLDCRTCHALGSDHALEQLLPDGGPGRACAACHESPHTPQ